MELQQIDLKDLKISPLNVRKHGAKSGGDLIPSIKASGLLQPLLVRKNCEGFEIIAGQRRFNALQEIAKENTVEPVPCVVMEAGDDAAAIEASLAENLARLPMDVLDQFDAFHALSKQGQSAADIAQHFGVTERLVHQRLAIAGLYAPIKNAFRNEEFGADTLQILTMATTRQQKDWYKLFKSDDGYAPQGYRLKSWLFGGEQIPVANALFDPETYKATVVSDLFGEDRYFADPKIFWEQQSIAIAEMMDEYREDGWSEVILLDVGERFQTWDFAEVSKDEGGKVYISVSAYGEVTAYEGQLSRTELKKRDREENGEAATAERPELTKSMQNYLALHRHAAVRTELLKHQGVALRLCVAQIIGSSSLWSVNADPQKANSDAIEQSLSANPLNAEFDTERREIKVLLGIEDTDKTLVYRKDDWGKSRDVHSIFATLETLSDEEVIKILTFITAETLPCGSAMVEGLGVQLGVDMSQHWTVDETFFDLLRDKEAINAMLEEIGGKDVANGNLTSTAKVQKQIVQDFMNGNGREQKNSWHPRYMAFPMTSYTKRGGIEAIDQYKTVKAHYAA